MTTTAAPAASALVLLTIGPWTLALPRRDVRELLSPEALATAGLPVLALDDALDPVAAPSAAARAIVVVLDAGAGLYALPCDRFEHRIEAGAQHHALPTASRGARSPVQGVLHHAGGVAALTDARALAQRFDVRWPEAELAGVR